MRKIISFMHISLDGFVAGPNGEVNWIKADEEIFDHVGKLISEGDTALYGCVIAPLHENLLRAHTCQQYLVDLRKVATDDNNSYS